MIVSFGGQLKNGGPDRTGLGSSFKEALDYYLHDKRPEGDTGPRPESTERVGFVHMVNMATQDPEAAYMEMATAADVAVRNEAYKRHCAATGKKYRRLAHLDQPVFVYSVDFHEDEVKDMTDAERVAHMREKALDSLRAFGLEHHQAVLVEHLPDLRKDGEFTKPHVHVCVNIVDPETGLKAPLKFPELTARDWAVEYEIGRGVIRVEKAFRNYLSGLENGKSKPDTRRAAQIKKMLADGTLRIAGAAPEVAPAASRPEWEARGNKAKNNEAKKAAAEIKAAYRKAKDEREARRTAAEDARREELNAAYLAYKAERAAVYESFKGRLDKVWKRPDRDRRGLGRLRAAFHDPLGYYHDSRERQQWRNLGRRQWQERRAFEARERTITGAIGNALRLLSAGSPTIYKGRLAAVFHLSRDAAERRRLFAAQQEAAKLALRERHNLRRRTMAEPLTAARTSQLEALAVRFKAQQDAIRARHAAERAAERAERGRLRLGMERAWSAWREQFNISPNPAYQQRSGKGDTMRPVFNETSAGAGPFKEPTAPTPERSTSGIFRDAAHGTFPEGDAFDGKDKKRDDGPGRSIDPPNRDDGPKG